MFDVYMFSNFSAYFGNLILRANLPAYLIVFKCKTIWSQIINKKSRLAGTLIFEHN